MRNFVAIGICCLLLNACATWKLPAGLTRDTLDRSAAGDQAVAEPAAPTDAMAGARQRLLSLPPIEVQPGQTGQSAGRAATGPAEVVSEPRPLQLDGRAGAEELPVGQSGVADDTLLQISVEEMEITRFIHLVFGNYLQVNYIVDPKLEKRKEKVTIHMQEAIPAAEFKQLIRELLARYSISMRERQRIAYIEPLEGGTQAIDEEFTIVVGNTLPADLFGGETVVCFATTRYIEASPYIGILKRIHPNNKSEMLAAARNTLVIRGEADQVRTLLNLVATFDKPYLEKQQVSLLELRYLPADIFQERLLELLVPLGVPLGQGAQDAGVKMVAIPEISSLLLISPEERWITMIEQWAERLDTPAVLGPEPRIFIYRPQNRTASSLAKVLLALRDGRAPSLQAEEPRQGAAAQANDGAAASPALSPALREAEAGTNFTSEELSIAVDEERNALVILTSPKIYAEAEKQLQAMDTLARQVMVEVTIAEVTLTDSLQYGVEWFLRNEGADWLSNISTLGRLGLGDGGVLATFTRTAGDFLAVLNAFAQDNRVNILSRPRLVVLDNESASFSVGTDVPVITSEATTGDLDSSAESPSVLRNIQYRKTGVSMAITPTIYSNGVLRLEIDQSISEAQKNDVSPETGSPLILDRTLNTAIILQSGEYILLGGLISETKSSGDQRVPLLGDIPLFGNLFKTTSSQTTRTELLIQVRPVILEDPGQAGEETGDFKSTLLKLQGIEGLYDQ